MVGKSMVFLVLSTCFLIAVLHPGYCSTDTLNVTWSSGTSSGSTTLYDGDDMGYSYSITVYDPIVECINNCPQNCGCSCSYYTGSFTGAVCVIACDIDGSDDTYYDSFPYDCWYASSWGVCGAGYFWSADKIIVPEFFTHCDSVERKRFVRIGSGGYSIDVTFGSSIDYEIYEVNSGNWEMNYIAGGSGNSVTVNPKDGYTYVVFYTDDGWWWDPGTAYIIGFNCCDPTIRSTFSSWCSSISCCDNAEIYCNDNVDNDCDGYVDCTDIDCCSQCAGKSSWWFSDKCDDTPSTFTRCTSDSDCSSSCSSGSTCYCAYSYDLSPKTWLYGSVYDYCDIQVSPSCGICMSESCLQCGSYSVCDCGQTKIDCNVNKDQIYLGEWDCDNSKYTNSVDLSEYIDFNSCGIYSCEHNTQCSATLSVKSITWITNTGKQGTGTTISQNTLECWSDYNVTVRVEGEISGDYCDGEDLDCYSQCDSTKRCFEYTLPITWITSGGGGTTCSILVTCSSDSTTSTSYDFSSLYSVSSSSGYTTSCEMVSEPSGSGAYLDDCESIHNMDVDGTYKIKVTATDNSDPSCTDYCYIYITKSSSGSCSATGSISCPSQSGNTLDSRADVYVIDATIYSGTCSASDGTNTYQGTFVKTTETAGYCEFTNLPSISGSLSLTVSANVDVYDNTCDQDRTLYLSQTCQYSQQVRYLDILYDYPSGNCGSEITVTLECVDAGDGNLVNPVKWTITDVSGVVVSSTCDSGSNPCTVTVITDQYAPSVSFRARCEVV